MSISFLLHKYRLNRLLILCLLNRLEWVDPSWCDSDQRESICNPFFFNFGIIFALSIFGHFVASKVFTFTFRCAMPQKSPVVYIRSGADQVEDVADPLPGPDNLWEWPSNGS